MHLPHAGLEQQGTVIDIEPLQADPQIDLARDRVPDGGYGWVCVACVFTVNCFTWGVLAVGLVPRCSTKPSLMSSSHTEYFLLTISQTMCFPEPRRWITLTLEGSTLESP